jgi:hypothetical protein
MLTDVLNLFTVILEYTVLAVSLCTLGWIGGKAFVKNAVKQRSNLIASLAFLPIPAAFGASVYVLACNQIDRLTQSATAIPTLVVIPVIVGGSLVLWCMAVIFISVEGYVFGFDTDV